ncbi:uncharacterized protein LY79DRAFT_142316 [Colletotrichum navitas]|uniref:Uncharacterized protein n=1 Tax=Colletotrichum navitas TaxID=681940 RepID=A0AAD8VCF7_9PEZI|nr:uncharacterized protein LY79DRAFT_142316 [Colletotrichum navitas]KAK1599495.1 hypothetical protein LY79DRAFT_142316 [Colletotrichum navitas]
MDGPDTSSSVVPIRRPKNETVEWLNRRELGIRMSLFRDRGRMTTETCDHFNRAEERRGTMLAALNPKPGQPIVILQSPPSDQNRTLRAAIGGEPPPPRYKKKMSRQCWRYQVAQIGRNKSWGDREGRVSPLVSSAGPISHTRQTKLFPHTPRSSGGSTKGLLPAIANSTTGQLSRQGLMEPDALIIAGHDSRHFSNLSASSARSSMTSSAVSIGRTREARQTALPGGLITRLVVVVMRGECGRTKL